MDDFNGSTKINIEDDKDFYKLTQLIGNDIQKIIQNVSSMNKIVMKINKIQNAADVKKKLRDISNHTQQLTKNTRHRLNELNGVRHSSQTEQIQFKIHKERLAERFKSALSEYQAVQCKVYEKENELTKLMKSSEFTKLLPPPSSSNHQNGYSTINDIRNNNQVQSQIQKSKVDSRKIQQYKEILQVEEDLTVVHEMFQDFIKIVGEHQLLVNNIEENAENSAMEIKEGNKNLKEVEQSTNKYRKKLCYLTIICTVIILVIIYVVFK